MDSSNGFVHLRHLLIHGARSLLRAATTKKDKDYLHTWALAKAASRGPHKAATAVANKLARIVWAVWSRHDTYHALPVAA